MQSVIEESVNEIFGLYQKYGDEDYIGEPVSQVEHMCQAAQLAEAEGYPEEVVLAAFFHDIGHLCEHMKNSALIICVVKDFLKISPAWYKIMCRLKDT
mgnify:CR=1 FL=1